MMMEVISPTIWGSIMQQHHADDGNDKDGGEVDDYGDGDDDGGDVDSHKYQCK